MATDLPPLGAMFRDRYRLDDVLGEGGFARVYRATDVQLDRLVAVKMLKRTKDARYETAAARFDREMRIVAKLESPYIAKLFDFGRDETDRPYMVFEHVDGRDLTDVLRHECPVPESVVIHVATQLCHALACAHSALLLHRDVKPANVRIYQYSGDPWCTKLLDFGIARPTEDESGLTATGMVVGTPAYMAPEQLSGRELGPSTDLYAVALIAIEMLCGVPSDNLQKLGAGHPVLVPDDVKISAELRSILNRMLSFDPAHRYARADDVTRQLSQLAARPGAATFESADTVPSPQRDYPEPPSGVTHGTTTVTAQGLFQNRGLLLLAVVVTGLIAAAGLVLGAMMRARNTPAPPVERRQLPFAQPTSAPPRQAEPVEVEAPSQDDERPASGCGSRRKFQIGTSEVVDDTGLSTMEWTQVIPSSYDPAVPHVMIMLLHDDLLSGRNFLVDSRFDRLAEEHGFVVVAPHDPTTPYAWRSNGALRYAEDVIDAAQSRLCIDPAHVFIVGHGAGGNTADALACDPRTAGVALVAYIPWSNGFACPVPDPVPAVFVGPMGSGHTPPQGGKDCVGREKLSFKQYDQLWRNRNNTAGRSKKLHVEDTGHCQRWEGTAPYMSCRLDGGRGWPSAPTRRKDWFGCDGTPTDYPLAEVIWSFFLSLDPGPADAAR